MPHANGFEQSGVDLSKADQSFHPAQIDLDDCCAISGYRCKEVIEKVVSIQAMQKTWPQLFSCFGATGCGLPHAVEPRTPRPMTSMAVPGAFTAADSARDAISDS